MTPPTVSERVSDPRGDLTRQAAELAAMRRMIEASQGCFSLSVAVCNSPALRDYLVDQIRQSQPEVALVTVPPRTADILDYVVSANPSLSAGLFLLGLEHSILSEDTEQATLRTLNASREGWEQRFRCPVVFWLPEYAAGLMSQYAADFWRYRSHRFEFVAEHPLATGSPFGSLVDESVSGFSILGSLTAEERRFRIAELEDRIADAESSPNDAAARYVIAWLYELALLCISIGESGRVVETTQKIQTIPDHPRNPKTALVKYFSLGGLFSLLGRLDLAEQMARETLGMARKFGDPEGMTPLLLDLLAGILARRGDTDSALVTFRESLAISEGSGKMDRAAGTCCGIGGLLVARGELEAAEEMYRKALTLEERLGRAEGLAESCTGLGQLFMKKGDLGQAEEMLRRSLAANEEAGRRIGVAQDHLNLGQVAMKRGDLDRAEEMYRTSLAIGKDLGDHITIGAAEVALARLAAARGDFSAASAHAATAERILGPLLDAFRPKPTAVQPAVPPSGDPASPAGSHVLEPRK